MLKVREAMWLLIPQIERDHCEGCGFSLIIVYRIANPLYLEYDISNVEQLLSWNHSIHLITKIIVQTNAVKTDDSKSREC
tara:strand:- start:133 stop:372 length:240 start_codon:yes stop_codon:yes gene_type:complete